MKKQTTIISIVAAIVVIVAITLIYTGMRRVAIFDNVIVPVDNSDVAVKVFLEQMIPHHQEAVDTSAVVMVDPDITNPEVRLLAARIYDKQDFEINQMKGWYQDWFGGLVYSASTTLLRVPYEPMMTDMSTLKGDTLAKSYLLQMINHHEHAIMSAAEVRTFIEKIEKKNSATDGQLTITNSQPGIDQTLIFTKQIEIEQAKEIQEMRMLLETM